ncbi:unnamed protein product [Cylindrotheca closterium]|uniref:Uncharacterized protein n=1 Tax=Cylindrotheca closterium TaxID=2856 RepID=A0AAD2CH63_9STRA|nr:unnamed protein product [Cylindrotheca closterium]
MSEDNSKEDDMTNKDPASKNDEESALQDSNVPKEEDEEEEDDETSQSPPPSTVEDGVESPEETPPPPPSDASPNADSIASEKEQSNDSPTSESDALEISAKDNVKQTDEDREDADEVKESNAEENGKDSSTAVEEDQETTPVVVDTVEESDETKSPGQMIQEEKIQMATAAAKSAISQQDPTEETRSGTTAQASPPPNESSVPLSDPQLFPLPQLEPQNDTSPPLPSPASSVPQQQQPDPLLLVQSSPHASPTSAAHVQASTTPMQASPPEVSPMNPFEMNQTPPQSQAFPLQASPRASPTQFMHHQPTPVMVAPHQQLPVPMQQASPQVSPSSAPHPGSMQQYPQQQPMHFQTTPQVSPTGSVPSFQQGSPVPQPLPNQMQGSPQASPSSLPHPAMQTYHPQMPPVSVQTTPQASPTSSAHTQTPAMVVPPAPSPQSSPIGSQAASVPVSQVQVSSPQAVSPTSALSNPPDARSPKSNHEEDSPTTEALGSPTQQQRQGTDDDDDDDDDSVEDLEQPGGIGTPGAKDQFHQDQFMEEFHTFQKKSHWEKFTYQIRNYTWREKVPMLMGIVLAIVGIGLVIGYFAGGSSDNKGANFVISSSDQCQAVINGNAIPNEDDYPVMRLNWIVDVSTYQEWETVTDLTAEVKSKFQSLVLPTLAGCINGPDDDAARAANFKVVNGFVRNTRDVGDCGSGKRRPCARFYINVALWMREETKVNAFLTHLLNDFGYEVVEEIESSDMISAASLVNIESFGDN